MPLRDILGVASYVGVDIAGRPDIELNLEKAERLPFDDDAFDTVLCADVLEHLDNLHAIFDELVRVRAGTSSSPFPTAGTSHDSELRSAWRSRTCSSRRSGGVRS
ncbi:MAG: methyltransferase domain-containing protein [Candidatus Eisenbacteria bacterium]